MTSCGARRDRRRPTCLASRWPGSSTCRWPTSSGRCPTAGGVFVRHPRRRAAGAQARIERRFGADAVDACWPARRTGPVLGVGCADARPDDLGAANRYSPAPMLPLSVVVPATNRPVTLERCLAAVRAGAAAPTTRSIVVDGPRRALRGRGPQHRRGAERGHDVIVFVDADVEVHRTPSSASGRRSPRSRRLTAVFGSYDDCAVGVRRRSRPSATCCTTTSTRPGAGPADDVLDRSRSGAARRVPRRRRVRRGALPRTRRSRTSTSAGACPTRARRSVLDPTIQGNPPQGVDAAIDGLDRLRPPGCPWVALECRRRRRAVGSLNLGWRHRLERGREHRARAVGARARFARADRRMPGGSSSR